MKRQPDAPAPRALGSVSVYEVLPLKLFGQRMNLGPRALADCQRRGLPTILLGRMKFVLGRDAVEWFRRLRDQQDSTKEDGHARNNYPKPEALHD